MNIQKVVFTLWHNTFFNHKNKSMKHTNASLRGIVRSIRTSSLITLTALTLLTGSSCNNSGQEKKDNTQVTQPTAAYTPMQQIFCHSILSNISAQYNGIDTPQIQVLTQQAIDSVLGDAGVRGLIGNWTRIWGPVVFKIDKKALNTMYIARQDSTNNYVVAIAGTNEKSIADWMFEDFDLLKTIPWATNNDVDSSKRITLGTTTGLAILATRLGANTAGTPMPAAVFLGIQAEFQKWVYRNPLNLWVTGHSLGGALSPAYALLLSDMINITKKIEIPMNINVLAMAGATPGNDSFSAYYNRVLGNNTFRVWNTLDMVPHGFEPDMLVQIPNLYDSDSYVKPFSDVLPPWKKLLPKVDTVATHERLTQLYPSRVIGFTSNYYNPAGDTTKNSVGFLTEVLYQHVPAYAVFFGIDSFQRATQRVLNLDAPFFSGKCAPTNIVNYDTTGKGLNNNSFSTMFQ